MELFPHEWGVALMVCDVNLTHVTRPTLVIIHLCRMANRISITFTDSWPVEQLTSCAGCVSSCVLAKRIWHVLHRLCCRVKVKSNDLGNKLAVTTICIVHYSIAQHVTSVISCWKLNWVERERRWEGKCSTSSYAVVGQVVGKEEATSARNLMHYNKVIYTIHEVRQIYWSQYDI